MALSVKVHPVHKAEETVDCKTSSSLTDLLTKTMNDELRLGFKFCWKLQTTVYLKVSECIKLSQLLQLRMICGIDGVPNLNLRKIPRRGLVQLTHLFSYIIILSQFPAFWEKANVVMSSPKTGNFPTRTVKDEKQVAFKIPYMFDFITYLCRQEEES